MHIFYRSIICFLVVFCYLNVQSQTIIKTSFEGLDNYSVATINNQNKWKVTSGSGNIVNDQSNIYQGTQALQTLAATSSLQVEHIAYASNVVALGGDVYIDFYIKQKSLPTANYAVTGYDLGTNTHRSFMLEFLPSGKLKIYDGSSGWATQPVYTADTWIRISIKVDNANGKYQVALNGLLLDKIFAFREIKNNATEFDYHSIRLSMSSGTCDAAVDNLYIGADPISDISFQESSSERTITIKQPEYGTISLLPQKNAYQLNEEVTASILVPEHYVFNGWTDDLSGTDNPAVFTVEKNMVVGASVVVDQLNPPAEYRLVIDQPSVGGAILVNPQQTSYYEGTKVTATLSLESGYQFDGWTGDLSGKINPMNFVIDRQMSIGAAVSEINIPAVTRTVSSVSQFKEALNVMNPGDTIKVLDGTYNLGGVKVTRGGSSLKPIYIKSENLHGAKITGNSTFTLSSQSYVVYEGFEFDLEPVSTIFKMEGCNYVRITRNYFKMKKLSDTQTSKWITVGDVWENEICNSHHNRIDHNLFEGKYDGGAWVVIDGSHGSVPAISQHDRIDHNIFRNNTPRLANEKETVRMGVSDLSKLDAYTIVENNLFEDCDGDPEIVSVKSCSNIVRNNTFRRCLGTLCLRQGNNSEVEGNFFFGEGKNGVFESGIIGCGGVRIYGFNHKITNNYFEGLTGDRWDAACTMTNGDVTNTSTSNSSHFLPENIVFAYNTLVNNISNIEIGYDNGGKYGKAPLNCKIENNIIVATENPIVKYYSTSSLAGVSFLNNIMYPTVNSTLGLNGTTDLQIRTIDPKLHKTLCRAFSANCDYETRNELYKLTSESPAINASAEGQAVNYDFEGQSAIGIRDIGADEYNAEAPILNGPMDENFAGPTASDDYLYETKKSTDLTAITENNMFFIPNPFFEKTTLYLTDFEPNKETIIDIFDCTGVLLQHEVLGSQTNQLEIAIPYKGMLIAVIMVDGKTYAFKLISK